MTAISIGVIAFAVILGAANIVLAVRSWRAWGHELNGKDGQ